MRIRGKLFWSCLLSFCLLSAAVLWRLQTLNTANFRDFQQASRRAAAMQLAAAIVPTYQQAGGWRATLREARRWPQLAPPRHERPPANQRPNRRPPPDHNRPAFHPERAPPGANRPRPGAPVPDDSSRTFALFDANGQALTRSRLKFSEAESLPLTDQESIIGYLAWASPAQTNHPLDQAFAARQRQALWQVGGLAAGLALIVSWLLSGLLTRRLQPMTAAAQALGQGDFSARIGDSGHDELAELAQGFDHMARQLEDSRGREQRWLADIAHELRTPLAVLRGELEALQDGMRTFSPQALDSLSEEVNQLNGLIDDLHLLTRADSGGLRLNLESIALTPLLQGLTAHYRGALQRAGIELDCQCDPGLDLQADPRRLRQVLGNLMQNLLRYATPGPARITATRRGDRVEIRIADSGPGVPATQRAQLFDRLYRADAARSGAGSGLGLSICRSIVELHGGQISALASPLGGLEICLTLPAQPPA